MKHSDSHICFHQFVPDNIRYGESQIRQGRRSSAEQPHECGCGPHADDQGSGIQSNEQHDEVCKSLATEPWMEWMEWNNMEQPSEHEAEQLKQLELKFCDQLASGNQTWHLKIPYKWRFQTANQK